MKTNKKSDNPKAFPTASALRFQEGMTLRDYFASKEKAVLSNLFWSNKSFQKSMIEQSKEEGKHISNISLKNNSITDLTLENTNVT